MDILIVIDNISQNYKWTSTFNTIKRWLIYWLNHFLLNNKLNSISISKTFPEPIIIRLEEDKLKIENIISAFESIIIKKSETYDCVSIKHICDIINNKVTSSKSKIIKNSEKITIEDDNNISELSEIFDFSSIVQSTSLTVKKTKDKITIKDTDIPSYSDILVFSSITNAIITDENLKYINISLTKINKATIINTSNKPIFKNIPKITEFVVKHLDNTCLYTELSTIINFVVPINDFSKADITSSDILNKLYEIEFEIHKRSHWTQEPIKKELMDIYFSYVEKLYDENKEIFTNFIKFCRNWVRMTILEKVNNINFNIPEPKIINDLLMDYSIEIIKFYNFAYPKMLSYHTSKPNKKYSFNLKKINQIDFSDIKISNFQNDESTNYLYSNTTLTNWKQEYINLNPFGLFISYSASILAYKGIFTNDILSTYPNMLISSVSNNWISLFDYYQLVSADIDSSTKTVFNINEYTFIDNLHGSSNIMLPVYINQEHWKITKKYWSFHLSFINQAFEFDYNKKMDNIYFLTIIKNINNLVNLKNNQNTIRLFFYIFRTCIQICIDNKYSYNGKADYIKHYNYLIESKDLNTFDKNFMDYLIRLVQVILTNNITDTELNDNVLAILYIYITCRIKTDFTNEALDEINAMNDENKNKEIEELTNKYSLYILCFSELLKDMNFFNNLVKYIYSIKTFNKLLKYLDKLNGCLPINEDDLNCEIIDAFLISQYKKINDYGIVNQTDVIIKTGLVT